jgi:oligoribonuclease NrnB/cAMP/cGMP phosphodiesterase (DHH superfamily)|uniref:Uncharacterized protein n=1 Tax=viral metagenome TaxID=1070528 RepID=A0A6C0DXQ7_9ZZZZ
MYKTILFVLFLVGLVFVVISVTKHRNQCKTKVVYKYLPQTQMDTQDYESDIFHSMFKETNPWIKSIDNMGIKKKEDINKFFISQYQ